MPRNCSRPSIAAVKAIAPPIDKFSRESMMWDIKNALNAFSINDLLNVKPIIIDIRLTQKVNYLHAISNPMFYSDATIFVLFCSMDFNIVIIKSSNKFKFNLRFNLWLLE